MLTEPDGTALDVGPMRRRPTRPWAPGPTPDYPVEVWLQVTRPQLRALLDDPPPGWGQLIADLVHRITNSPGGPPPGDPADRFPNAHLRRWIHIRDRRCVFPGCRVAPHRGDIDHTLDYAKGGTTVDGNLAAACGPDHDLKTKHGWTARQTRPGHVTWTSPLGHTYTRTPPPGPDQALTPMPNPGRPEHDIILGYQPDSDHDTDRPPTLCVDVIPHPTCRLMNGNRSRWSVGAGSSFGGPAMC